MHLTHYDGEAAILLLRSCVVALASVHQCKGVLDQLGGRHSLRRDNDSGYHHHHHHHQQQQQKRRGCTYQSSECSSAPGEAADSTSFNQSPMYVFVWPSLQLAAAVFCARPI